MFRAALATTDDVLEHHANFDWERGAPTESVAAADDEGRAGLRKLQRAAENWDAPATAAAINDGSPPSRRRGSK